MKYDKDTMNSLQEAYSSVNKDTYKGGKVIKLNRNKQTGNPPVSQNKSSTTSNKKLKGPILTGGDGTAYYGEEQEPEGMKYSDKKKIQRQKQLLDASKKAPVVKNKIVPMKTRTEEAIKMTKKEYAKTHKDFKSTDKKNPRVTRYVPGKGTVSTPVEITDEVDKKKEMEDKMKEVEDMRSLPTRMNLIKTKLRAMGLNMSHVLKGKELSEVIDYTLNELNRYEIETGKSSGSVNMPKGTPTQKGGDTNPVARKVRTSSRKETGRPEGQRKTRKKGEITPDMKGPSPKLQKKIDNLLSRRALDAKARKAGYKNTQDYVDVQAVRQGGLGT